MQELFIELGNTMLWGKLIPTQTTTTRRYLAIAFTLLIGARLLAAEVPSPPVLSADEIVARMAAMDSQRSAKSQGYRGVRHYTVDYKGFPSNKHAEMVVQIVASPPQKEFTVVSESGSKLMLNRVLRKLIESEREASVGTNRREVKLTKENYDFTLVGAESVQDRPCYVLQVSPKRGNKFLYRGKVWVDAEDFAVTKISASPAKNPSFWISSVLVEHQYEKHGDLWLPRSNRSNSKVRFGGRAVLTIDYQQYELPQSGAVQAQTRQQ